MRHTNDAPSRPTATARATAARRGMFVIVSACCTLSLFACGLLTSLDGLTGGTPTGDARTNDSPAVLADGTVVEPTDAGQDGSEPFVVYLPAAGNYGYVQNTAAYAGGTDFDAAVADLGVDTLTLVGLNKVYRRPQASQMPARVDHADGGLGACWTLSIQVLPNGANGAHTEDETFCARNGGLLDPGVRSTVQVQTWNLGALGTQTSTAVVDCSASNVYVVHAMQPGDPFVMHACMGTAGQTNGTYLSNGSYDYIGLETIATGDGLTEAAFHTLRTRAVTGAITGNETTDFYLSTRDGLPLRIHRHTHIDTPVTVPGINSVNYDERGSDWLLSSHIAL